MTPIFLLVQGAAGRMGQRIVALASASDAFQVVAALDHAGHPQLGQDAGQLAGCPPIQIPLSSAWSEEVRPDVVIDFSTPEGTAQIATQCRERKVPLVAATTGLTDDQQSVLRDAAGDIPLLWAPSMSVGVNLMMRLTQMAAEVLKDFPDGADVEIIERHHRFKEDAPSGTALRFGQIIAEAMGQETHRHGREGRVGQRPHGEIGYHALRVGDNPGEHTIVFGLLGETLEFTVRASNRDCYAQGALLAARFVAEQSPGLYAMADVLKFKT